ncbi:hypothetical protein [Stakelama saccharophila]|uniref:Uncharacterized protein n=1 Tax=Stakelama saccharophila TaxID=3075605 RepID=A0ABZ0BD42_9SPHN|nr:hypothetical protein [Stakelama sp. W311]WNO54626.1 hypothetical protein RPR59_05075 [Stakelama sp. W311]
MTGSDDKTEPDSNLSTEHQREGDAKRPDDRLDQGQPGPRHEKGASRNRTKLTKSD